MKILLWMLVALAGAIALAVFAPEGGFVGAKKQEQIVDAPAEQKPYGATEFLGNARFFEAKWNGVKAKKGEAIDYAGLDGVMAGIDAIPADAPEKAEALAIRGRLERDRDAIKRASDAYAAKINQQAGVEWRKAHAEQAERSHLDRGRDYHFRTEGKEGRILRIRYILMSRPLVHQMTTDTEMVAEWRRLGFRQVIFTNGHDNTWKLDLVPPARAKADPKGKP